MQFGVRNTKIELTDAERELLMGLGINEKPKESDSIASSQGTPTNSNAGRRKIRYDFCYVRSF